MNNYKQILEAVNRGIKFALDDYEDDELQGQTNSKVSHQHGTKDWLDLMNEVVDLGLPSGTLWCKYNLGCDTKKIELYIKLKQSIKMQNHGKYLKTMKYNDFTNYASLLALWYGEFYAWGELEGNKSKYDLNHYKFDQYKFNNESDLTKYNKNDNLTELLPEDDVAYQNKHIGNYKFHIPTKEQCEELINYTKNYWVKNYDPNKIKHNPVDDKGIQGLNGRVFEGKNGNQLFIPAAGYCSNNSNIYGLGTHCNLWSSSIDSEYTYYARYLYIDLDNISMVEDNRYVYYSVRPVINL